MAKEPETSVHIKIPTAAIKAIDWLVQHQNSEMTRYPKVTRSDMIKTEIARLGARAMEHREEDAREREKRALDAESTKAALTKAEARAPKRRKTASK